MPPSSESHSQPDLPYELFDPIIDHLQDDVDALRACALVCRLWLPISRFHLFSKIVLRMPPPSSPAQTNPACRRLQALLSTSPEIIPYVHDLFLFTGSSVPLSPGYTVQELMRSNWVFNEPALPLLLMQFTNLSRFDFTSQHAPIPWEALPHDLILALYHAIHRPSIRYIRLCSWVFAHLTDFIDLVGRCPNLTGLSLWSTKFGSDDTSEPFSPLDDLDGPDRSVGLDGEEDRAASHTAKAHLEFLTLDYIDSGQLEGWFWKTHRAAAGLDLTSLKELRIAHSNDELIERLLSALGNTLERFHLKPGRMGLQPLSLHQNTALKSIRLTLEEDPTAVTWAASLLSSVGSPNTLERVAVEIFIEPKKLAGWSHLGEVLSHADLNQVDIGIFDKPSHTEFQKIEGELSQLKERGVLRMYQLGSKGQRLSTGVTPAISRYEGKVWGGL